MEVRGYASFKARSILHHSFDLIDADYPTPLARNRSEFLHWMVININGTQFRVPNGDVKVEYLPPIVNSTAGKKSIHSGLYVDNTRGHSPGRYAPQPPEARSARPLEFI